MTDVKFKMTDVKFKMTDVKLKKVKLDVDFHTSEPIELVLYFDNNRYHTMKIESGFKIEHIINNLKVLVDHLEEDLKTGNL